MSEDRLDILVILGTDHHRFDRLVGWLDDFLEHPDHAALTALVQLGSTPPPRRAKGVGIVAYDELQRLIRHSTAVVTHGGPATMLEVRKQGRKPVVVPRDPALGEHVDQHQQEFSRRVGRMGLVTLCEDRASFAAALAAVLADPEAHTVSAEENHRDGLRLAAAVDRTGRIIDGLGLRRARRRLAKS
ncbi:Glycosyltransferase 28 domain protein [Kribbella flavida DSM 17836]|uniref:Glycosyltransferase 28 domain protein n=1 Tax=Kribbella flavida (strain DSM 17836 / JCM 10339 / NBRC 14399) TaxID=479435 RepID=D2PYZ3_KRIFD|nr:glycosyltransferase [Kribbella flavida]ADB31787.1 Glycosyltransferase 28 domain protein [Kribbella flavida DSM 17836]